MRATADQLHRHLAPELTVVALGEVNDAHAPVGELADDAIGTDARVQHRVATQQGSGGIAFEDALSPLVGGDQSLDLGVELAVIAAGVGKPRIALADRVIQSRLEERLDLSTPVAAHRLGRVVRGSVIERAAFSATRWGRATCRARRAPSPSHGVRCAR